MKVLIVYYSTYGHVHKMAEAIAEGVREVDGAEAVLRRVPETLPAEVLEKMGAVDAQKSQAHVPICTVEELASADAVIFGTPTRFGNMCGQMRQFLDATGQLWAQGALVGKVGSVFTSSATQHGGQESTILTFHVTLLHHHDFVAHGAHDLQVMADEQISQIVFPLQVAQKIDDLHLHGHVQRAGGFVQHHETRAQNHRAGNRDALALTA